MGFVGEAVPCLANRRWVEVRLVWVGIVLPLCSRALAVLVALHRAPSNFEGRRRAARVPGNAAPMIYTA